MRLDFLMTTALFALGSFLFIAALYIFSRKENILGIRLIGATAALNCIFMFGYGGFLLSDNIDMKIWLNHIQYLAIPYFSVLWFMLSHQQRKGNSRFGLRFYGWIMAIPILATIANFLYPATEVTSGTWIRHLLFSAHEVVLDPEFGSGFVGVVFQKGVLYYVLMGYAAVLALISLFNYIQLYRKSDGVGKQRAAILGGASCLAFIMTILTLIQPKTAVIDATPFVTGTFSFLTFLLLFKYELFELIPQAYRQIYLENIVPIIIFDRGFKVVSANRAAKEFLREVHPNLDHSTLKHFEGFDPGIFDDVQKKIPHEWIYPKSSPERYYLIKVMDISKHGDHVTGYTMYYEDITAHKNQLKKMEFFALYDDLTRIRNRRYFFQLATESFDKAIENREKIAVIMFDLDDFKEVNDIYGHQAGDVVLQDLAALISKELEPDDLFARYGGEEFIIFQKNRTIEEASKLARRLCAMLNGHVFSFEKRMIKTTASFGVAGVKKQIDQSLDNYIKQADDALYQAKAHGKKQIFVYSEQN